MCVLCNEFTCENGEYCGLNPNRPPIDVSFQEYAHFKDRIWEKSRHEKRPVLMPKELLTFIPDPRDRPVFYRGHSVAACQAPKGCSKEDLIAEVHEVFQRGMVSRSPKKDLKFRQPILSNSDGALLIWPPSGVCVSSRLEIAALFPLVGFDDWHYSALYAFIPAHFWDTRRLQHLHTDLGTDSIFAFEFVMNSIPPSAIVAALIFKRRSEDGSENAQVIFDKDTEIIPSPAYRSGSLGEPGDRAMTLLSGRRQLGMFTVNQDDFVIPASKLMTKDIAIRSFTVKAAQWLMEDADALRNFTIREEDSEYRKIMERFQAEKPKPTSSSKAKTN